jgi:uncharacterized protein (UPF0333 family)
MMKSIRNQSGQILVEYILLLLIAVSVAMIMTTQLVGRRSDVDSSGILIKSWHKIITAIGNDLPDCPNQTDFSTPNCP